MTRWHEGTLAALDFETTGLDVLNDRVVQASLLIMDEKSVVQDGGWQGLVNPGIPVPREVTKFHGITTKMVESEGHEPARVFSDISRGIDKLVDHDIPLVIFNAPFDWQFLLAETARHDIDAPRMPQIIDPLTIDRALDKYRKGGRDLKSVARHYNVGLKNAHDAVEDSKASIGIARQIGKRFPEVGDADFKTLHKLQEKWYDQWAIDFARYLKRSGKDSSTVGPGWPINKRHRSALS